MDFISRLRMNNLFGDNNKNPLGPPTGTDSNPIDLFHRIYPYLVDKENREFEHQKELMQLQNQPKLKNIAKSMLSEQPEQPKPMNVVYKPSPYEEMTAYQRATTGLKRDELEQKGELGKSKLTQGEEKIQQSGKLGEERVAVSKEANRIRAFRAEHPNMDIKIDKGGNFIAFDRITGKGMDTGISSGTLSDEDKLSITGDQKLEQIGKQGDIRKDIQNTRGEQQLSNIAARVAGQKEVQSDKADLSKPLPTQTRVSENLRARELFNTDPDLSPFIHMTSSGFDIDMPGRGGPTDDQFKRIKEYIYGKAKDIELKPDKKPVDKKSSAPDKKADPLGLRK